MKRPQCSGARGAFFERLLEKAAEAEARARKSHASRTRVAFYASDEVERLGLHQLLRLALANDITVVTESREATLRTLLEQQPVQVLTAPIADYQFVQALSEEFTAPALYIARTLKSATSLLSRIEQNGAICGLVVVSDDFARTCAPAVQTLIRGESFVDPLIRDVLRQLVEASVDRHLFDDLSPRLIEMLVLDLLGFTAQEMCDYLHITPDSLKTYWRRITEQVCMKRSLQRQNRI